MTAKRSISISISPELQSVAEGLLATGRYGNISDVMRSALRLLEERELAFQKHRTATKIPGIRTVRRSVKAKPDAH